MRSPQSGPYGPCKSTQNAVPVFERVKKRNKPKPGDLIFPMCHHEMFSRTLDELGRTSGDAL
jgi:hypothetical protein